MILAVRLGRSRSELSVGTAAGTGSIGLDELCRAPESVAQRQAVTPGDPAQAASGRRRLLDASAVNDRASRDVAIRDSTISKIVSRRSVERQKRRTN